MINHTKQTKRVGIVRVFGVLAAGIGVVVGVIADTLTGGMWVRSVEMHEQSKGSESASQVAPRHRRDNHKRHFVDDHRYYRRH